MRMEGLVLELYGRMEGLDLQEQKRVKCLVLCANKNGRFRARRRIEKDGRFTTRRVKKNGRFQARRRIEKDGRFC